MTRCVTDRHARVGVMTASSQNNLVVVPERGKASYVVGRYNAADAREGLTFEVSQLGADHESTVRPLVEILPEADLGIHEAPVVGQACRRRAGCEACSRRNQAAAVVVSGITIAERRG